MVAGAAGAETLMAIVHRRGANRRWGFGAASAAGFRGGRRVVAPVLGFQG
jgi:hypothetical protein